jgi:hypothetical protein
MALIFSQRDYVKNPVTASEFCGQGEPATINALLRIWN